jgi:predicted metal-dependent phosphoesterase TrpH
MLLTSTLPPDHDWHLHTTLSDGFAPPEEVLRAAAAQGLRSVAITDHDCLDAHLDGELATLGEELGVQLVAGAEIDCSIHGTETELLAYHFDPTHPGLSGLLRMVQDQRWERFRFYCHGMAAQGAPIDPDEVLAIGTRVPIKVHLYRALLDAGKSFEGEYKEYKACLEALGEAPHVEKPALAEVVELVRSAGGTAILAHPLYYREPIGLEPLVRAGADAGCAGTELVYPYGHGIKGIPRAEAEAGLAELCRLVERYFPADAMLTRGSDMHEPAEWPCRLAELRAWESGTA